MYHEVSSTISTNPHILNSAFAIKSSKSKDYQKKKVKTTQVSLESFECSPFSIHLFYFF